MNYQSQLLKEHSRKNTDLIATAIGNSKTEFKKIVDIIYHEQPPLPQRASWVLAIVNKKHPELVMPYLPLFIKTISDFKIGGIKRNMLSVLAGHECPKKMESKLIDVCFAFLLSNDEPVAVKVYAMQALANICKKHPELKNELKAAIEDQLPKSSVALYARAKRILK